MNRLGPRIFQVKNVGTEGGKKTLIFLSRHIYMKETEVQVASGNMAGGLSENAGLAGH